MHQTLSQNLWLHELRNHKGTWMIHILCWSLLFIGLVWIDQSSRPLAFKMLVEAISILFYIVLVYFNIKYLIPKFLTEKTFLKYCLFMVGTIVVLTPIKVLIVYTLFLHYPEVQPSIIKDRSWYFLTNFLVMGGSTLVKIITDWLAYQRDSKDLQTQTMQSELRFLKSQINPHFLFNTLNNLYALTLKKSDKAPEIVIKLSEMMRYMLYECNEKRVELRKEVHYLKNYLDLEELRKGKTVDINFQVKGAVENQQIAPLLFIPFLENSFKHGANNHISKGFVNILLEVDARHIRFFIENSKAEALPTQNHKRSGGIGLVNVRRRLDLLYPNKHELIIEDNPKTYSITLDLDL